jgi:hypothetical protein
MDYAARCQPVPGAAALVWDSGSKAFKTVSDNSEIRRLCPSRSSFECPPKLPLFPLPHKIKLSTTPSSGFFPDKPQRFSDFEFSCYSQTTEDGALLAVLQLVGVSNHRIVEICSGVGWENNAANLLLNFGFEGILFDGNPGNAARARAFFSAHDATRAKPPRFKSDFVTAESVNSLVQEFEGDIDVFSLDMDGVDYWIWDALTVVSPRIVIVEIQEVWGWEDRYTRPYRADHTSNSIPEMGASIRAFMHLADKKGYRLVGCVKAGFNAIFLRNDVGVGVFAAGHYDPMGCFAHWTQDPSFFQVMQKRRLAASDFDWVDPAMPDVTASNSVERSQRHVAALRTPLKLPTESTTDSSDTLEQCLR